MLKSIEITKKCEAISVTKSNATSVDYYLYPEFEVHNNTIPSHSSQDWHQHQQIEEVIIAIDNSFCIDIFEDNQIKQLLVQKGDLVRLKQSVHRLINPFEKQASFIVFRFVPDGIDKSNLIKNDKIDCENILIKSQVKYPPQ